MTHDIKENERMFKARGLRYKKSILSSLSYDDIYDEIQEIQDECDSARYYFGDSEVYQELDPETQEETEMMFANLSDSAYRLWESLRDTYINEMFDDCVVNMLGNRYKVLGYDTYEEDYYNLSDFESGLAKNECKNRLMKLTKAELLKLNRQVMGILVSYFHVRYLYDYLKASVDIFDTETKAEMQVIDEINSRYADSEKEEFDKYAKATREYNRMLDSLPDKVWLL